jgi:hypothetical protein
MSRERGADVDKELEFEHEYSLTEEKQFATYQITAGFENSQFE